MLPAPLGGLQPDAVPIAACSHETRAELEYATLREVAGLEKRPEAFLSKNEYWMTVGKARCFFVTSRREVERSCPSCATMVIWNAGNELPVDWLL